MEYTWVVDINETSISIDTVVNVRYEVSNGSYFRFSFDEIESEDELCIWEKVLEAGLPQEVDEFLLLVWW
jgi:hypothetical protein